MILQKKNRLCPFCPLAFQVLRSQHFPPSFLADKERKEFTCDLPPLRWELIKKDEKKKDVTPSWIIQPPVYLLITSRPRWLFVGVFHVCWHSLDHHSETRVNYYYHTIFMKELLFFKQLNTFIIWGKSLKAPNYHGIHHGHM